MEKTNELLGIDVALFASMRYCNSERRFFSRLTKPCEKIHEALTCDSSVDIILSHHHSPETIQVSALCVNNVPSFYEISKTICNAQKDLSRPEEKCERQHFVLGETTTRGGGDIALFNGNHVRYFRRNLFSRKLTPMLKDTRIKIVSHVKEIDVFFQIILHNMVNIIDDDARHSIYNLLQSTTDKVRCWLARQEEYTCESKTRFRKVRLSHDIVKALKHIIECCENNNVDTAGARCLLESIEDNERWIYMQYRRITVHDKSKPFVANGKRGTVSDLLETKHKENQSMLRYIATVNATLFGASIMSGALFAYTIRGNISGALLYAIIAQVLFTFSSLAVFALPLIKHFLPSKTVTQKSWKFANDLNNNASANERIVVGCNDLELSKAVIISNHHLYRAKIAAWFSMAFLAITIAMYAYHFLC